MKTKLISIITGTTLGVMAAAAQADVVLSYEAKPASPKNVAIAACVEAIQGYHSRDAKLFLNNKASYRNVDGRRSLSVTGWVWRNGERVRVSHECSNVDMGEVALSVVFAGEEQMATR